MFKFALVSSLALFTTLAGAAPVVPRGSSNTGDATFFAPGLGACGQTSAASDLMVAVSSTFFNSFGSQSNGNPVCGRQIKATNGEKSVTVTVLDKCPGCAEFDLDLSPAAFNQLADPSVGRIHGVTWELV